MSTRAPGNEEQSGKVTETVQSGEIGRKFRLKIFLCPESKESVSRRRQSSLPNVNSPQGEVGKLNSEYNELNMSLVAIRICHMSQIALICRLSKGC